MSKPFNYYWPEEAYGYSTPVHTEAQIQFPGTQQVLAQSPGQHNCRLVN